MSLGIEVREVEEELREAAANGDMDAVMRMIESGVDVNSQNPVNGWTALHWACKRGHHNIVNILLKVGADAAIHSVKGETCAQVATNPLIKQQLGADSSSATVASDLPIMPNYMRNPVFPYGSSSSQVLSQRTPSTVSQGRADATSHSSSEVVLKVRIANSAEKDFIEVDLPKESLTYDALLSLMCSELDASKVLVQKVRKLPDTIVRRDKDVQRLKNYQELELVLANQYPAAGNHFQGYKASVAPKHFDMFY